MSKTMSENIQDRDLSVETKVRDFLIDAGWSTTQEGVNKKRPALGGPAPRQPRITWADLPPQAPGAPAQERQSFPRRGFGPDSIPGVP